MSCSENINYVKARALLKRIITGAEELIALEDMTTFDYDVIDGMRLQLDEAEQKMAQGRIEVNEQKGNPVQPVAPIKRE